MIFMCLNQFCLIYQKLWIINCLKFSLKRTWLSYSLFNALKISKALKRPEKKWKTKSAKKQL